MESSCAMGTALSNATFAVRERPLSSKRREFIIYFMTGQG